MDGIEELQRASAGRTSQSNDVCHYSLYFPPPRAGTSKAPTSIESAQATAAAILEYAQELCDSVQPEGGYIWQRESFKLRPSKEALPTSAAGAVCLEGSTTVGESVEDEWWIVWLLREISKKWSEAVVEIHDNDGQFLLIEAAEHLPSWLNPDNADNRVSPPWSVFAQTKDLLITIVRDSYGSVQGICILFPFRLTKRKATSVSPLRSA